ncbi:MAG: WbqC family protein [Candidatus Cryptobacteroides sp.]|nr:WbqC family protein [Candidatus Cryptobacteroides sp.]
MLLLETAFMPPVSYFAAIAEEFTLSYGRVVSLVPARLRLEACENYQKQSYRNRCRIYAAGGVESLTLPVVHEGGTSSLPIREIRVDWSRDWLPRMERAIVSAYESSPYFEYYRDSLFDILESRPEKLFDLNIRLIHYFLGKIGISADIDFTTEYERPGEPAPDIRDLRGLIHPKRPSILKTEKPYWQVFAAKYGYKSDLSVMDLLFNEGPDSISYLKKFKI